jgi:cell fate (sporulation/competence/biofilm development) regulator YlbF (YheA/YmcA/DUF963 family)
LRLHNLKDLTIMPTLLEDPITTKTQELCETILSQPGFQRLRDRIDAFMGDENAKSQYNAVTGKQSELQQRQHSGQEISDSDIAEFEQLRETLVNNPIARGFLDAQQEMHRTTETVSKYVSKTFQLGRIPTEDDFEQGCCGGGGNGGGGGCGCSH